MLLHSNVSRKICEREHFTDSYVFPGTSGREKRKKGGLRNFCGKEKRRILAIPRSKFSTFLAYSICTLISHTRYILASRNWTGHSIGIQLVDVYLNLKFPLMGNSRCTIWFIAIVTEVSTTECVLRYTWVFDIVKRCDLFTIKYIKPEVNCF